MTIIASPSLELPLGVVIAKSDVNPGDAGSSGIEGFDFHLSHGNENFSLASIVLLLRQSVQLTVQLFEFLRIEPALSPQESPGGNNWLWAVSKSVQN
jgi:hypothetical protein